MIDRIRETDRIVLWIIAGVALVALIGFSAFSLTSSPSGGPKHLATLGADASATTVPISVATSPPTTQSLTATAATVAPPAVATGARSGKARTSTSAHGRSTHGGSTHGRSTHGRSAHGLGSQGRGRRTTSTTGHPKPRPKGTHKKPVATTSHHQTTTTTAPRTSTTQPAGHHGGSHRRFDVTSASLVSPHQNKKAEARGAAPAHHSDLISLNQDEKGHHAAGVYGDDAPGAEDDRPGEEPRHQHHRFLQG